MDEDSHSWERLLDLVKSALCPLNTILLFCFQFKDLFCDRLKDSKYVYSKFGLEFTSHGIRLIDSEHYNIKCFIL